MSESGTTMCRCCLQAGKFGNMFLLFYKNTAFSDLLKVYTIVEVQENDSYPKGILCGTCINQLVNIEEFKEQCLIANKTFFNENEAWNLLKKSGVPKSIQNRESQQDPTEESDTFIQEKIEIKQEELSNEEICIEKVVVMKKRNALSEELMFVNRNGKDFNEDAVKKMKTSSQEYPMIPDYKNHETIHEKLSSSVNSNSAGKFGCELCDKEFSSKYSLTRHGLAHEERTLLCQQCGKTFSSHNDLLSHIKVHVRDSSFECSYCGKTFAFRKSVKFHELIHRNLKPFTCHICEKQFRQKSHLDYHLRTHSGEKPYRCRLCRRSFSYSGSLKAHNCSVIF